MDFTHPRDLSPEWFDKWSERAAIVNEGCKLGDNPEGVAKADRIAFRQILAEMEREKIKRRP